MSEVVLCLVSVLLACYPPRGEADILEIQMTTSNQGQSPPFGTGPQEPISSSMEVTVSVRTFRDGAGGDSLLAADVGLVGRDAQIQQLMAVYRRAAVANRGSAILVHGPEGVGKKRLCRELLAAIDREGRVCRALEAYPGEGGLSYVRVLLKSWFAEALASQSPAHALVTTLRGLVPRNEVVEVSVAVADLLNVELPGQHASLTSLRELLADPGHRQPFLTDILRRLLRRESERMPVVMVLRRPEHADSESRNVLSMLLSSFTESSVLVIAIQLESQTSEASAPRRFVAATTASGADETGIDLPALQLHSQSASALAAKSSRTRPLVATGEGDPWDQLSQFAEELEGLDGDATQVIDRSAPAVVAPSAETLYGLPSESMHIQPLADMQMESLVHRVLAPVRDLPDALVGMLLSAAGGIPGKLEQSIVALVSHRVIEVSEDDGSWHVHMDRLMGSVLPADLEALSLARLRALPPKHRNILELASVIGPRFRVGEVLALMRIDPEPGEAPFFEKRTENRLRRVLLDVQGRDILVYEPGEGEQGDEAFRFRFERERELLQVAVPDKRRAILHRVLAQVLEHRGASPAEIAAHWRAGQAHRRAAVTLLRAGIQNANEFKVRAAVEALEVAAEQLGIDEGEELFDGLGRLARCYLTLGEFDNVDTVCSRLAQYAYAMNTPRHGARAFLLRGVAGRYCGRMQDAYEHLERSLSLAKRDADDPESRAMSAEILDEMVTNRWSHGAHYSEALELADQALALRRELNDVAGTAQTLLYIGQIQYARRRPGDAKSCFEQAESLAESEGLLPVLARARNAMGITAYFQRDFDRARAYWTDVLDMCQTLGDRFLRAAVLNNMGEMAWRRGNVRQASDFLHRAVDLARSIGEHRVSADALKHLSQIALAEVSLDQAVMYGQQALEEARRSGVRMSVARALKNLGEVWSSTVFQDAFKDSPDVATQIAATHMTVVERVLEAERCFREAITVLEAMGDQNELRQSYKSYARFLRERGREREAADIERHLDATEMFHIATPGDER